MFDNKIRGFTLLELMIAVAIFAVIGVAMNTQFTQVIKSKERTDEHAKRLAELQRAMVIMQTDFSQIIARTSRDEFGKTQPAVKSLTGSGIEFTRTGWTVTPFSGGNRSDFQRVYYQLEEDAIVRGYWQHPDKGSDGEPQTNKLLTGVEAMAVTYWQQNQNSAAPVFGAALSLDSTEQWPPLSVSGGGANSSGNSLMLPVMIQVELEMEILGEIRRLFVLVDT